MNQGVLRPRKKNQDAEKTSARSGKSGFRPAGWETAYRKISLPFYLPLPQRTKPYENAEKTNLTI